jgi:hypothetical protein
MKDNKETSCNCFKWGKEGAEGRDDGVIKPMYNISLLGIINVNPPRENKLKNLKRNKDLIVCDMQQINK